MARLSRRNDAEGISALQQLLEGTLAGLGMESQLRELAVLQAWERIAGHVVSMHAHAEAMRDRVLVVLTDTPAWAQELHMRQAELLARLRSVVGEDGVQAIHFRSGLQRHSKQTAPQQGTPGQETLPRRQASEVHTAAARIGDRELRERVERAFASLERIAIWRRSKGWSQCARCGQWQRTGKRWCASCAYRRGEGP
jgi:hypothetical protein